VGRLTRDVRLTPPLHAAVPQVIERPVSRRPKQVRAQRLIDRQRLPAAPQLEHHVLHDLLRHRATPQHPLGESDERRIMSAKDRVEGVFVAPPDTLEEFALVQGRGVA
jgi:hypothetical protein